MLPPFGTKPRSPELWLDELGPPLFLPRSRSGVDQNSKQQDTKDTWLSLTCSEPPCCSRRSPSKL
jgi:hypothetical protein